MARVRKYGARSRSERKMKLNKEMKLLNYYPYNNN